MTDKTTEALDILRADYHNDLRGLVSDLRRAIEDGDVTDRESASDWVHHAIDGHHNIIYTYANQIVILVSENSDAFTEDFGSDGLVKDGSINWAGIAFSAMERDLYDAIDRDGLDLDKIGEESEESEEN